ncbi:alpha/beta hydrolase [Microbacterium sp. NPDC057650]|uniref:alpha/beta hydrolase n=1 Tax=unclassified Microbacterium TaxID=2609290 RepID=UPI00366BFF4E
MRGIGGGFMLHWLLALDISGGAAPWAVWAVTAALLVGLLARGYTPRRSLRLLIAAMAGGNLGFVACALVDLTDVLGTPLPPGVSLWVAGAFAAVGLGIVSLWDSGVWRKTVAVLAILAALLSAALGVNAAFGLDRTAGDLFGLSTLQNARHFAKPLRTAVDSSPLYEWWRPPAGMPHSGEALLLSGNQRIPSTAGFAPRDASIYLPPAALVQDPPALPVIVQMMGLPGSPTPTMVKEAGDRFAAKHHGLAPIVIVADQLGAERQNPGCADSKAYGGVDTYVNVDIPNWIRTHLRVMTDHADWTISGYSNGGACSFLYGAQHPDVWGALADISGEEYPGQEDPGPVLDTVFGGDVAAFNANKPENALLTHPGQYKGHVAVFTVGANDHVYSRPAHRATARAQAAGFETHFYAVPDAGHVGPALSGGLDEELRVLAPVWGLAP